MFLVKKKYFLQVTINPSYRSSELCQTSNAENLAKLFTGLLPLNAVLMFYVRWDPESASAFTIRRF